MEWLLLWAFCPSTWQAESHSKAQCSLYLIKSISEAKSVSFYLSSCASQQVQISFPRTEKVWGRSSQRRRRRWGHHTRRLGPNINLWPRGHWDRIMTQLPVYYHLPNLIRPNPKPANTPDLHRSCVCVLHQCRKNIDRLIFPHTEWKISALIQPIDEKCCLFRILFCPICWPRGLLWNNPVQV